MLAKADLSGKRMLGLGKAGALGVRACLASLGHYPRAWGAPGVAPEPELQCQETKVGTDTLGWCAGPGRARPFVCNLGGVSNFCLFFFFLRTGDVPHGHHRGQNQQEKQHPGEKPVPLSHRIVGCVSKVSCLSHDFVYICIS